VTNTWGQIGFHFAPLPVRGAVWLLGGALGALGWIRRRQAAS
jgi:hypothetical protein